MKSLNKLVFASPFVILKMMAMMMVTTKPGTAVARCYLCTAAINALGFSLFNCNSNEVNVNETKQTSCATTIRNNNGRERDKWVTVDLKV